MARSTRHQRLSASTSTYSVLTAFLLLPTLVSAQTSITLRSFADPKAPNFATLSTACQTIINTPLSGCQASDFDFKGTDKNNCSVACLSGLAAIQPKVKAACADVVADPSSILSFFQRDQGVAALCKNVALTNPITSTSSQRIASTVPLSTGIPTPLPVPVSTLTSATVVVSSTVILATPDTKTTKGGLLIDGGSATPTQSGGPEATVGGVGSGGGSPFDGTNFGGAGVKDSANLITMFIAILLCLLGLVWV